MSTEGDNYDPNGPPYTDAEIAANPSLISDWHSKKLEAELNPAKVAPANPTPVLPEKDRPPPKTYTSAHQARLSSTRQPPGQKLPLPKVTVLAPKVPVPAPKDTPRSTPAPPTRPVIPTGPIVPKTAAPLAKPPPRPTVLYTEPPNLPKGSHRQHWVRENITLRAELKAAQTQDEAVNDLKRARSALEQQAKYQEGLAKGFIEGAKSQIDGLRAISDQLATITSQLSPLQLPFPFPFPPLFPLPFPPPPAQGNKRSEHNKSGYEQRQAKKARREAEKTANT